MTPKRIYTILLTAGLALCAALGIGLLRVRNDTVTTMRECDEIRSDDRALQATLAHTRTLLSAEREDAPSHSPVDRLPAESVRQIVAPMLAKLKADHAAHPRAPKPPPPPAGPAGMFFPELMGDPEYSQLLKQWHRLWIAQRLQGLFEGADMPAAKMDRVFDLLAERAMVRMDYQSLRGAPGQEQADRDKINEQIRSELGVNLYDRLSSAAYRVTRTNDSPGAVGRTDVTREINEFGDVFEGQLAPLRTRLSYSAEPLTAQQAAAITGLFSARAQVPAKGSLYAADVRALLSLAQQGALDELKAEDDARTARYKLPSK